MSQCILTIKVNDKELQLPFEGEATSSLDEDVITALKGASWEDIKSLVDNIREKSNKLGNATIKLKDLQDGIIANCSLNDFRNDPNYVDITFPEIDVKILQINNLSVDGQPVFGRVLTTNGEEVFVSDGSSDDIKRICTFLNVREKLKEIDIAEDNPLYKPLTQIIDKAKENKKITKVNSINDLLLHYLEHKSLYNTIMIEGESAKSILDRVLNQVRNFSEPVQYSDVFISNMSRASGTIKGKTKTVNFKTVYTYLKSAYPELINKLDITSPQKLKNLDQQDLQEFKENLKKNLVNVDQSVIDNATSASQALFDALFSIEPSIRFKFEELSNKGIVIKYIYKATSTIYDFTYDTIQSMEVIPYNGYRIYKYMGKVFVSRGTLTVGANYHVANSVDEAKAFIDNRNSELSLSADALLEFKWVKSDQGINEAKEVITSSNKLYQGQIVNSIDIPIKYGTLIYSGERYLLGKDIGEFKNYIEKHWSLSKDNANKITEVINTPEKAAILLYKVNELVQLVEIGGKETVDRKSNDFNKAVSEILENIENADIKHYYIESAKSIQNGKFKTNEYVVIPVEGTVVSNPSDYKHNYPMVAWMNAVSEKLNEQFGVKINLLTSEEISNNDELQKIGINIISDKAFIYNGEVYVNTTIAKPSDLIHEHVHLLLGILKNTSLDNYVKLMSHVLSTPEGSKLVKSIKESYPNLSKIDLAEEAFAKLFSGFIRKKVSQNTSKVFSLSNVNKDVKSIFRYSNITDIESFYGKTIQEVFNKFYRDATIELSNTDISFGSTQNSRRITNYIADQIKQGNIKEEC